MAQVVVAQAVLDAQLQHLVGEELENLHYLLVHRHRQKLLEEVVLVQLVMQVETMVLTLYFLLLPPLVAVLVEHIKLMVQAVVQAAALAVVVLIQVALVRLIKVEQVLLQMYPTKQKLQVAVAVVAQTLLVLSQLVFKKV